MAEPAVTPTARVITAIDAGAATTSVALLGRLANRWRLLGSLAAPAGADESALILAHAPSSAAGREGAAPPVAARARPKAS